MNVGIMLPVRHHSDFIVYRIGIIMVLQMLCDEGINNLATLFHRFLLVW